MRAAPRSVPASISEVAGREGLGGLLLSTFDDVPKRKGRRIEDFVRWPPSTSSLYEASGASAMSESRYVMRLDHVLRMSLHSIQEDGTRA